MSPLAIVLADTHMPRRARVLPEELVPYLDKADLVLHAGDLIEPSLLDVLAFYAPSTPSRETWTHRTRTYQKYSNSTSAVCG